MPDVTPSVLISRRKAENRVESFESYRPYLFSIAYRMLGSAMDAEDMVQETYLRYQGTPPQTLRSLKAFLTTIITRLCVDQLQLARRKREQYMGPWLPEPILTTETAETDDPQERVDMQESISLAFLVLLEQLQPFERAVFLLHEVFAYEFAEIATMFDKSEAACRRSFSRAKQQLREATLYGQTPKYLIRNNESKFGPCFAHVAATSGIKILKTPYHTPRANAICERFLGSVRRECLDHVLILHEKQLHRILRAYVAYFNSI